MGKDKEQTDNYQELINVGINSLSLRDPKISLPVFDLKEIP